MREYIYTMTFDELKKDIDKGRGKPEWTADPPIYPSWKVVEMEAVDIPEFLERGGLPYGERLLTWGMEFDEFATPDCNRVRFVIPPDIERQINAEIDRRHRAKYDEKVEEELGRMIADLNNRMQQSIDPIKGRSLEIQHWERVLEGAGTEGLSPDETNLRTAMMDVLRGNGYLRGTETTERRKRFGRIAVPPHGPNYISQKNWRGYVDTPLRRIYIRAEAAHKFLQWLKELQPSVNASDSAQGITEQPEWASTPPQGNEGGTGAKKCALSYAEVALILAYERISVTNKADAREHGAKYGRLTATNSDVQLLDACIPVFSKQDRLAPLDSENNGKKVKPLQKQLKKIEPHLSDRAKPLFTEEFGLVSEYLEKLKKRKL